MEEIKEKKYEIRRQVAQQLATLSDDELLERNRQIEDRLFDFANFLEAKIVLLYLDGKLEVASRRIIEKSCSLNKIVVLPVPEDPPSKIMLLKVDHLDTDLTVNAAGKPIPDPVRCKRVPMDRIDIALIPGVAFDEKGGRIGMGDGFYDRLIPKLPATTRKVALSFDDQVLSQVPMEPHDKHVDIIITEKRVIYKI
ncbi:MAG: 5-formyltetrahydrofolate cyclo-ligase [Desulfobacterales bacterium]|jgi:5-formyltetrahydrofolate cyclo-ligase|nr:5-formyltetrahydrofolate cyclo-ligase [Desulfobacterales bacterium]